MPIRRPHDSFLNPTRKWEITGVVGPQEVGPGCQLRCAYCNQASFDVSEEAGKLAGYISLNIDGGTSLNTRLMVGNRVERKIAPAVLVEELRALPYYDPAGYLMLENFNDPGTNWRSTCELIRILRSGPNRHEGPITLITKMGIPPKYVKELKTLKDDGAKIVAIVTYAGLPEAIEPAPVKDRLLTLERLHDAGIPTVVSVRPLIKGINMDEATVSRVISVTSEFTDFYIAGGLFVFDEWTPRVFEAAGYKLEPEYLANHYEVAKVAPTSMDQLVDAIARKTGANIEVAPHTSCVIARVMTEKYGAPHADKLAHWASHNEPGVLFDSHCAGCGSAQRAVCHQAFEAAQDPEATLQAARSVLHSLGYTDATVTFSKQQPGYLLLEGLSLTYGELSFVRQATGQYVNNVPDLEGLLSRTSDWLKERGLRASEHVVGAVRCGEEWLMFTRGDLDGHGNLNTERSIRSCNVARIHVVDAESLHRNPDTRVSLRRYVNTVGGDEAVVAAEVLKVLDRLTWITDAADYKATIRSMSQRDQRPSVVPLELHVVQR